MFYLPVLIVASQTISSSDRFIVSTLNSLPATILGCLETVREADAGTAAKPRMSLGKFLLTSNW